MALSCCDNGSRASCSSWEVGSSEGEEDCEGVGEALPRGEWGIAELGKRKGSTAIKMHASFDK